MALTDVQTGDVAHIIQLAVAPVFLLSGVGVTLGLFTNRLARIVDRARLLEDRLTHDRGNAALREGLRVLARRSRYINSAITLGTLSGLMVALTVVLLFMHALIGVRLEGTIAVVFVVAMLALTAALLVFLIEVRIATAALNIGGHLEER
jgi:CBS domain containing-hemolysin-like protein